MSLVDSSQACRRVLALGVENEHLAYLLIYYAPRVNGLKLGSTDNRF